MCVALWQNTFPSAKGIARMYSINRYTFVSAMKRRSAQMDTLRAKRFRAESIYLIFQNIQQRTEYSHLGLNLGLQSMNSAQMSNRNNLSCGMRMVFAGRRMRVHNHHPVHNMNVGKQGDAYLIR